MRFNTMVKKYVYYLEKDGEVNKEYEDMVLENAVAKNRMYVLSELKRQVLIFREYDEQPDMVNFNYLPYCDLFMKG